ncbi:restriction endonuclease subunit S [Streptomyces sp. NE06-03C]|uniref:restriction endonuclease subunit S n=1 Tax=Streptomyces sp. NE06-03C TaxID=3028694 RepID=UPI0029AF9A35|nr:restriction endonuclease subunit S [Streptomyces sp. NE06-03C]MDX2918665.1 restriction endonuclease subunit S [Streptomyces sp. NE06-03C]
MTEWPTVRFEEIAAPEKSAFSKPYGSAYTRNDYVPSGIPLVRGVNLGAGPFHDDDFVFISSEKADTLPGANLKPGDLVITHRGTIGQVSMIPRNPRHDRYVLSTSQVKARLDHAKAVPEFYYYWLLSPVGQKEILQHVSTVGVPGLVQPVATVKSFKVPVPSLDEQRSVVAVLGALDDKIAVNERIATTADDLSRALFGEVLLKSVDGFSDQPLSAVAEFINGRAFTKGATGTGRMVVRIAEINSGPGVSTVYNEIDVPDRHLARPGDLLFAWSGSLTAARWFRPEAIINQHIFKCIPRDGYPIWLVSQLVHRKLDEFRSIAADKATTMGHIQRRHLDEPVPVPGPKTLGALDRVISPLWERALVAEQESLSLATLRGTLLPQLMSGRIRVKDAEKIVEDHV